MKSSIMELASVLNYLDDGVRRNGERLEDLKSFLRDHPSKSLQKKKIRGGVYYCLMYRQGGRIRQEYVGSRKRIDVKKERQRLREYNKKLNEVKRRYRELKERNGKLQRALDVVMKLYHEK